MHFDFEIIKKHPLAVGGSIAVLGAIVFYLIVKRGSSGSGSDASGSTQEFLQTLSAQQAQAAAYNAQITTASIQANVAALGITKQAESYQKYLDTQQSIELGTAQLQSDTIIGAQSIQASIAAAQVAEEQHLVDSMTPLIARHYPGSSTGVVQVISALQGQGPAALANTNPGAYSGGSFGISVPGVGSVGVKL